MRVQGARPGSQAREPRQGATPGSHAREPRPFCQRRGLPARCDGGGGGGEARQSTVDGGGEANAEATAEVDVEAHRAAVGCMSAEEATTLDQEVVEVRRWV